MFLMVDTVQYVPPAMPKGSRRSSLGPKLTDIGTEDWAHLFTLFFNSLTICLLHQPSNITLCVNILDDSAIVW